MLFTLLAIGACGEEPPVVPSPVPAVIVITASDTLTAPGHSLAFTAQALDSEGQVVATDPVAWTVSDTMRGRITTDGTFTGGPWVGRPYVRARLGEPWAAAQTGEAFANFSGIGAPALGPDGTVYVLVEHVRGTDRATLVALNPGGIVQWTVPLNSIEGNYPVITPTGDVLVVGKQVYLIRPDGTIRWQALMEANNPSFKSGAVNRDVAFVTHGYNLTALTLARGDTVWQSSRSPLSEWLVPATIVGDGLVYAKHSEDTLFAFRPSDGAILRTFLDPDKTSVDPTVFGAGTVPVGSRFYLPTVNSLAAFDTAGPLLWITGNTGRGSPEPAVGPTGELYVQNRGWGLQAIRPDGTIRWYRRRFIPPQGPYSEEPRWTWYGGAALAAGGIIYAAGYDRFLAYDVEGTLLWEYLADSAGVPQAFIGSPAIGPDGTVYTYTATDVYAFWGAGPPEPNSPWPMWRHDAQRTGWVR
jgi:outer membrane protein assembly factor BamB